MQDEGDFQVNYKICSTTLSEEECNSKNFQLINEQQIIQLQENGVGSYNLIFDNKGDAASFVLDNGILVEQYEQINSTIDTELTEIDQQYLIYSCGEQQIEFVVPQDQKANVVLQISKYGYLTAEACTGAENQFCNITPQADDAEEKHNAVTLARGLWRINAHYTNLAEQSIFYFKQIQLLQAKPTGTNTQFQLEKNRFCPTIFEYDLTDYIYTNEIEMEEDDGTKYYEYENLFYDYINSVGFVSTFDQQIINGFIEVSLYENYPFTQENLVNQPKANGSDVFSSINLRFKYRHNGQNLADKSIYVVLKQVSQERYLGNKTQADAKILAYYNLLPQVLGLMKQQNFVKPITENSPQDEVEAATNRMFYNFYHEEVNVSGYRNLNGNDDIQMRFNYAFMVATGASDSKFSVGVTDVNDKTVTEAQAQMLSLDSGMQAKYVEFKMANETDLSKMEIQRFQPVYFTVQQWEKQSTVEELNKDPLQLSPVGLQTVANRLITIDPNTEFKFGSYGLVKSVNMKINITDELVEQGKVVIKMKGCLGSQASLYWSKKNPLVSRYDYYGTTASQYAPPTASAQLTIPVESKDDTIYVNAFNSRICPDNLVQVYSPLSEPQTEELNKEIFTTMTYQQQARYMIDVNNNIRNQPQAYLRIQLTDDIDNSKSQVYGVITSEPITCTPQEAGEQIILGKILIDATRNIKDINIDFKNIQTKYVYVSFINMGDSDIKFKWQMVHPDQLFNQQVKVAKLTNEFSIYKVETQPHDQVSVQFTIEGETARLDGLVYVCQQTIPFVSVISSQTCEEHSFDTDDYTLKIDNSVQYSGNVFLAVKLNNEGSNNTARLNAKINHKLSMNSVNEISLAGEKEYYYVQFENLQNAQQYLSLEIKKSENVAICASLQFNQPEYYAWQSQNLQCQIIIGNSSAETETKYPLSKYFQVTGEDKQTLYLTVVNLGGLSKGQEVILRIDDIYKLQSNQISKINMGYDKTGMTQYPQHINVMYEIEEQNIPQNEQSSLVFYPDKDQPFQFLMTPFNVYASVKSPIVTYSNSNYTVIVPACSGSIVVQNNDLLENKVNGKVLLFVGIDLSEEMQKSGNQDEDFTRTIMLGFETQNKSVILNQLQVYSGIHQQTEFMMGNTGDVYPYVFNATYLPTTFYLEVCQGNPTFQAGYSNFYYNVSLNDTTGKDGAYFVWQDKTREEQDPTTFVIASGTRYSLLTNYFLQVGDLEHDWKAKMYVSNRDARPAAAIRTLYIGKNGNTIKARFSPAMKGTIAGDNDQLEYAIFVVQDLKENQASGLNPKSSCGFLHGYQLTDFQKYSQYDTWYTIQTSEDKHDEIMNQLKTYDQFYITVVVRDPATNMTNMYNSQHMSYDSIPEYSEQQQDNKSGLSGGAIAGIVIGVIAFVAIVVVVVIYLIKRKGGKQQKTAEQKQDNSLNPKSAGLTVMI